jgi:glycosyltransferase involved in cell wall biosynthesis
MPNRAKALIGKIHAVLVNARIRHAARSWPKATPQPRPSAQRIRVSGFFNEPLGIGRAAHLTASALTAAGYSVVREDVRPLHRHLLTRQPEAFEDASPADVWIIQANPPEARFVLLARDPAHWRDTYRIAYWVWESSLAPRDWIQWAAYFHEIWVPSPFAQQAFAAAFTQAGQAEAIDKLRVMPHPVPLPDTQARVRRSDEAEVRVLTLFDPRSDFARKNPEGVIRAWTRAFSEPGAGRLRVKTYAGAEQHPAFRQVADLAKGRPDIAFICETLNDAETQALIAQADIVISLHRGEGFGLPLAEAMAQGIPVIATGWSGNMAFMTPDTACLVPFELLPATSRYNGPQAQWAEPDLTAAAEALRQLVQSADARQALGQAGRVAIGDLWSYWQAAGLFSGQ